MPVQSTPLRVLIVDHAPVFGGVEALTQDLLVHIDPAQFSVAVATDTASQVAFHGGPVHRLPLPSIRRRPAELLRSAVRLARLARNYDLMMTMTARTHPSGALAAVMARRPLVWRLADTTLPMSLARALATVPAHIVANSDFIRLKCSPAPRKTSVVYPAVRDRGLPPAEMRAERRQFYHLPPDVTAAVSVGRLTRQKGHATFVRALKLVGMPGIIAGGEDPSPGEHGGLGLRRELEAIRANVRFLGHVSHIWEVLSSGDIFVQASRHSEAFARTVIEAMLAGLPVIATRVGGLPEAVGDAGILIPPDDVDSLARALSMDAGTRQRLGAAGRERALACFQFQPMIRRYEQVWLEAAGI